MWYNKGIIDSFVLKQFATFTVLIFDCQHKWGKLSRIRDLINVEFRTLLLHCPFFTVAALCFREVSSFRLLPGRKCLRRCFLLVRSTSLSTWVKYWSAAIRGHFPAEIGDVARLMMCLKMLGSPSSTRMFLHSQSSLADKRAKGFTYCTQTCDVRRSSAEKLQPLELHISVFYYPKCGNDENFGNLNLLALFPGHFFLKNFLWRHCTHSSFVIPFGGEVA